MKKMTTEQFISRSKQIHGNKYDYSKVEYKGCFIKVCIICPKHGEFWQEPRVHLSGSGCQICRIEKVNKQNTKKYEQFIDEAKQIHGNKYDYSKVEYKGCFDKVCITCPKHGEFWQTPDNHLHGHGCKKCAFEKIGEERRFSKDKFIENAKIIHGEKYDYSKVEYKNCDENIVIICPIHGEFEQTPYNHLHSSGCPYCKNWKLEEEITKFLQENNILFERQKRFNWLGKQSLDVYIPSSNIAIECQGIQHFKPINYFGGIKEFNIRKKLDKQKAKLCKENGVKLLYYSNKQMDNNIITDKEIILNEIKKGVI